MHTRGKKKRSHNVYISLFFQGSVPAPRGSDVGEHATAVKPNGGHVSYSDTSAATSVNGKTPSEEFDHIIHSMAQVKSKAVIVLFVCGVSLTSVM